MHVPTTEREWQTADSAPENVIVMTKIDDVKGVRNVQSLKRRGRLWFTPDDAMYVYYTPTHWRSLVADERLRPAMPDAADLAQRPFRLAPGA